MLIRTRANGDCEGSTMIAVIAAMSVMATLSLAVIQISLSARDEQAMQIATVNAQYAAEAALAASMVELQNGGDGVVFSQQAPLILGQASAFVSLVDNGNGQTELTANGGQGLADFAAEVVMAETNQSFWNFGAFGDEGVHADSNAQVDSYVSTDGPYDDVNGNGSNSYANPNGSVGSNADISTDSNVKIWGDVTCGPSGSTTVGGNSQISGSIAPAAELKELPPITLPSYTAQGNFTSTSSSGETISSGDWSFDDITADSNSLIIIEGPANITCSNFVVDSNAEIRIDDTNGPVTIYVEDDFVINSNGEVGPISNDPAQLSFNLLSDNILDPSIDIEFLDSEISFDSNAVLYGTIYAPSAAVVFDSNFELFGAVAARTLELNSNSKVHYDEALADGGGGQESTWEVVGWRVTGAGL